MQHWQVNNKADIAPLINASQSIRTAVTFIFYTGWKVHCTFLLLLSCPCKVGILATFQHYIKSLSHISWKYMKKYLDKALETCWVCCMSNCHNTKRFYSKRILSILKGSSISKTWQCPAETTKIIPSYPSHYGNTFCCVQCAIFKGNNISIISSTENEPIAEGTNKETFRSIKIIIKLLSESKMCSFMPAVLFMKTTRICYIYMCSNYTIYFEHIVIDEIMPLFLNMVL